MSVITPELAERMAEFIRDMVKAGIPETGLKERKLHAAAASLASFLPDPIDPDLIEARKVVAAVYKDIGTARAIMNGNWDSGNILGCALAAIKRGRELAGGAA